MCRGNLVGVAPASAIFMACYEPTKVALTRDLNWSSQGSFLAAGATAGLAASLVRVPTEVVKQRMQSGEFKHARTALVSILRREGRLGLFAGYGAFLLRDLPFDAVEFWAFDTLKLNYRQAVQRDLNPLEASGCGAVAGAVTAFATTPLDVIKTRLMTQGSSKSAGMYKNAFDCAIRVYREEGAKALFRGWEPRVTWIAVGGCIFFGALEEAKKRLVPKSEGDDLLAAAH
jgi:solute carrier family 25 (mitochondrial S-adenosylmethionine transporter), member 26